MICYSSQLVGGNATRSHSGFISPPLLSKALVQSLHEIPNVTVMTLDQAIKIFTGQLGMNNTQALSTGGSLDAALLSHSIREKHLNSHKRCVGTFPVSDLR